MKILWVCTSPAVANKLRKELGDPDGIYFIGVGAAIAGMQADRIVLDDLEKDPRMESDTYRAKTVDWCRHTLVCRLMPGGKIQSLTSLDDPLDVPI